MVLLRFNLHLDSIQRSPTFKIPLPRIRSPLRRDFDVDLDGSLKSATSSLKSDSESSFRTTRSKAAGKLDETTPRHSPKFKNESNPEKVEKLSSAISSPTNSVTSGVEKH
jgi:hypothetical protein